MKTSKIVKCLCVILFIINVTCARTLNAFDRFSIQISNRRLKIDEICKLSNGDFINKVGNIKIARKARIADSLYSHGYNLCNGLNNCKLDILTGLNLLQKVILMSDTRGGKDAATYIYDNYSAFRAFSEEIPKEESLISVIGKDAAEKEKIAIRNEECYTRMIPSPSSIGPNNNTESIILKVIYYFDTESKDKRMSFITQNFFYGGINVYSYLSYEYGKLSKKHGKNSFAMGLYISKNNACPDSKRLLELFLKHNNDNLKAWELSNFDIFPTSFYFQKRNILYLGLKDGKSKKVPVESYPIDLGIGTVLNMDEKE